MFPQIINWHYMESLNIHNQYAISSRRKRTRLTNHVLQRVEICRAIVPVFDHHKRIGRQVVSRGAGELRELVQGDQ